MKVVTAIPTYNGAAYLKKLLPQVQKQNFYKVYILDDCSTDSSRQLYKQYPDFEVIYGSKNVGPVANRNRILNHDLGDIILFLDDDMELLTDDISEKLTQLFQRRQKLAVLGALIFTSKGKLINFYFDRPSSPLFTWLTKAWRGPKKPDSYYNVTFRESAWVLEGACAFRSAVFKELNGFDTRFKRFQEGPDICKRAIDAGYLVAMTNIIRTRHLRERGIGNIKFGLQLLRSIFIWYKKTYFTKKT